MSQTISEKHSSGDRVARRHTGKRILRITGLTARELWLLVLVLVLIVVISFKALWFIERAYSERVVAELTSILEGTDEAIHLWSADKKAVATSIAQDPDVIKATQALLEGKHEKQALLASPAQIALRTLFKSYLKGGSLRGFFIIDSNHISLASSRDANVGTPNLLSKQPALLGSIWRGKAQLSAPMPSDVPLFHQYAAGIGTRDITMFVGAPIKNADGETIAILTLRTDPNATLFKLLANARPGASGEAYVFDQQGLMHSPSRFHAELVGMGLLESGESNIGKIYVRDNSLKSNTGLTRMATSAVQLMGGRDTSGYADYRGVPVVGAWKWERELNLGLAVEQDYNEAFSVYFKMRDMSIFSLGVSILALIGLVILFGRGRRNTRDTQSRLAAVVEHTVDSIIVINHLGIIESVNPAVQKVFGYQPDALIGKNVKMLMPSPHQELHDGYVKHFMDTGKARVIGIGREIEARRADGSLFPAELTISKFELESGTHFAGTLRDISQRKAAEDELEEERRFSEKVLNALTSHVAVLDGTGTIIFVNKAWIAFGKENGMPDDYSSVGENYLQTMQASMQDSDISMAIAAQLKAMLAGSEESFSVEYPCHAPEEERWFQLFATSFQSRGKLMVVTSHLDVTMRREAEEELLHEKEVVESTNKALSITQKALGRSGIGEFWINARTGAILKANDRVTEYLGYSREELFELSVSDWAPDFPMDRYTETIDALRKQGWGRLEVMHKAKDGTLIPVEVIIEYSYAEGDAEEDMLIVFSIDISERKRVESELRMKSLVASETDNGVIVTDLEQHIKWVNPGFTRITGYAFDEVVGKKPGDFLQGPDTDKEAIHRLGKAIRNKTRIETDIVNYHKNGSAYILHLEIMPIQDESGEVVEFIALESDVTEQRLAEDRLKLAKAEAEAANIAKSSFLAAMSHEIRTPLNGVVGTIDLLDHSSLNASQHELVNTAKESSASLLSIVDDILDFSKIEAGRLELDVMANSMESVVEGAIESLQALVAKSHVELLQFCEPAIPTLLCDGIRIRQVLFNLVGNAIKFSSKSADRHGKVEVRAMLESSDAKQSHIRLEVRDNGIGMSEKQQQQLFRPFEQAESSTTRRFGGTGLGLTISLRLVEMMGGSIEVESKEGEGSLFKVLLSLDHAGEQMQQDGSDLSGVQVLLVTGDAESSAIIESYIGHAGARVISTNPAEAEKKLDALLDGEKLLVIDTQGDEQAAKRLLATIRDKKTDIKDTRLLMVSRGKRRKLRQLDENGMTIDMNAMRRKTLLNAVAALAGLESPEMAEKQQVSHSRLVAAPSLEEAKASGSLILMAEDNATNRKVISQQLAVLGYACESAENGREALEKWRKGSYALMLTDCHMPEMDGYELASTIRAEEGKGVHMPIIAITADALKGTAEKCQAAGMDDYLTKPMQIPQLGSALEKWLGKAASAKVLAPSGEEVAISDEAIDAAALGKMLGTDDAQILAKFYADFLNASSETAEQIRAAYAAKDLPGLGNLAHKLKSSARTVGANALADCCASLEQAGKQKKAKLVKSEIVSFNRLYAEAEKWLVRHAKSRGKG